MTGTDAGLEAYRKYREKHPELFINAPGTAFEIIFDPGTQRRLGAGIVYEDPYYVVIRDAVRFRDGHLGPYIRFVHAAGSGGAAALPVLDGKVILLLHQRHATRVAHWEIPRGFAGDGEDPRDTARREIMEELGVAEPELHYLGHVHPDTGATSGCTSLYLAELSRLGLPETDEGIDEVRQVAPGELDAMIAAGDITDSFTLAAIVQARAKGLL